MESAQPAQASPQSSFLNKMTSPITSDQIWIDPYTNERVWIFNPMHIVQLTKQQQSKFVRVVEGFKKFSNKWFSHVLLLIFLILYGFLGAYIFVTLEAPIEEAAKKPTNNMRERIIKELWWSSKRFSHGWWLRLAKTRFKEFEKQLHEACIASQTTDSDKKTWDFWQALFFSSTIFTTIGYGHVVPKTDAGRVASIIYAFIGIPLLLMVLADLGKLFTRAIKFVFKMFRRVYYTRQIRKMRQATRAPTQFVSQTFNVVNRKMSTVVPFRKSDDNNNLGNVADTNTTFDDDMTIPDFEVDDEFNLPISVAMILLLSYMMLGAAVFTMWEKWTFFESFYFVYISLSTIGFGDYVPEHPAFMMCTFIYLLFGLALTSMCINVVQEKLSATFQKAKLRIGATMGLDLPQMVEEELNQDNISANMGFGAGAPPPLTPLPRPILKEHGVGDSFRERRLTRNRQKSNQPEDTATAAEEANPTIRSEDDGETAFEPSSSSTPKPTAASNKSVDFDETS